MDSADLALCSSDGVEFKVHKIILELASSIFSTMLALPQSSLVAGDAPSRLTVNMSEDSQSLRMLLRFCYPRTFCPEPELLELVDIGEVSHGDERSTEGS